MTVNHDSFNAFYPKPTKRYEPVGNAKQREAKLETRRRIEFLAEQRALREAFEL